MLAGFGAGLTTAQRPVNAQLYPCSSAQPWAARQQWSNASRLQLPQLHVAGRATAGVAGTAPKAPTAGFSIELAATGEALALQIPSPNRATTCPGNLSASCWNVIIGQCLTQLPGCSAAQHCPAGHFTCGSPIHAYFTANCPWPAKMTHGVTATPKCGVHMLADRWVGCVPLTCTGRSTEPLRFTVNGQCPVYSPLHSPLHSPLRTLPCVSTGVTLHLRNGQWLVAYADLATLALQRRMCAFLMIHLKKMLSDTTELALHRRMCALPQAGS